MAAVLATASSVSTLPPGSQPCCRSSPSAPVQGRAVKSDGRRLEYQRVLSGALVSAGGLLASRGSLRASRRSVLSKRPRTVVAATRKGGAGSSAKGNPSKSEAAAVAEEKKPSKKADPVETLEPTHELEEEEKEEKEEEGPSYEEESARGRIADLRAEFLKCAAASDRGQKGDAFLKDECDVLISELEYEQSKLGFDDSWLQNLEGEWKLVYASEDPTRSSPFFWAFRRALAGVEDPFPSRALMESDQLSENILSFTDNIPVKWVGVASQTLDRGQLVSKVVVGVFMTGESTMTTTCSYEPDPEEEQTLRLKVEKTQVAGDSIAAQFLSQYEAPTGEWLSDAAEVRARVTFLDDDLRIVRDADRESACFVYARVL